MPVNDTNSSQPNPFDPNATPPLARQDMDRIQQMSNWQKRFDIRGPGVTMKNTADSCTILIKESTSISKTSQGIPPPTQRYQVLTPVDDSLRPIWTFPRFSS